MKKILRVACLALTAVVMAAGVAMAAEGAEGAPLAVDWLPIASAAVAAFAIAVSSAVGALAQSKAIVAALKGIARNPGASGKITTPLIIGLAMIESLVIYALVIALILVLG